MRDIRIDKLIVNCAVGEAGDRLTRAARVLTDLTGQDPVLSKGACVPFGDPTWCGPQI